MKTSLREWGRIISDVNQKVIGLFLVINHVGLLDEV